MYDYIKWLQLQLMRVQIRTNLSLKTSLWLLPFYSLDDRPWRPSIFSSPSLPFSLLLSLQGFLFPVIGCSSLWEMRIDGKKEPHVYVWLCWGFLLPLWFAVWLISQEYAHMHSHSLLFPFNSLFLPVNLHANAVVTCHCISCFFPNTHTVFLSLSRTSWGLEVKSLCGRPVCICDLTVYRLLPRKDATRRHTWADLKQNLQWIQS